MNNEMSKMNKYSKNLEISKHYDGKWEKTKKIIPKLGTEIALIINVMKYEINTVYFY